MCVCCYCTHVTFQFTSEAFLRRRVYNQAGTLVMSTAQEGLLRFIPEVIPEVLTTLYTSDMDVTKESGDDDGGVGADGRPRLPSKL